MQDGWFKDYIPEYNDFVKSMLAEDIKAMNAYMNKIALNTVSYFDSGTKPSEESLEETAAEALLQIERKKYGAVLEDKGIAPERLFVT